MLAADQRDESIEQDGMCISCRNLLAQCREEEATASFCDRLHGPIADWFANIIAGCTHTGYGFEYSHRFPEDINERCAMLYYVMGEFTLIFQSNLATLQHSNGDWSVQFYAVTPLPIILSAIKAAVEHEAK